MERRADSHIDLRRPWSGDVSASIDWTLTNQCDRDGRAGANCLRLLVENLGFDPDRTKQNRGVLYVPLQQKSRLTGVLVEQLLVLPIDAVVNDPPGHDRQRHHDSQDRGRQNRGRPLDGDHSLARLSLKNFFKAANVPGGASGTV